MQDKEPNCEKERERENERETEIEQRHRKKTIEINITTQYRQTLAVLFFSCQKQRFHSRYIQICAAKFPKKETACARSLWAYYACCSAAMIPAWPHHASQQVAEGCVHECEGVPLGMLLSSHAAPAYCRQTCAFDACFPQS